MGETSDSILNTCMYIYKSCSGIYFMQGPLKPFAQALGRMQSKLNAKYDPSPLRTYIVTSRDCGYGGERAMNTLNSWGLAIDELFFMDGAPKGPILKAIKPHIFFDDQTKHIETAKRVGAPAAHVKYGVAQAQQNGDTKGKV